MAKPTVEIKVYPEYEDEDVFAGPCGYAVFSTIKVSPWVHVRAVVFHDGDNQTPCSPRKRVWFTELVYESPDPGRGSARHRVQPMGMEVTQARALTTARRAVTLMSATGRYATGRDTDAVLHYFSTIVRQLEQEGLAA